MAYIVQTVQNQFFLAATVRTVQTDVSALFHLAEAYQLKSNVHEGVWVRFALSGIPGLEYFYNSSPCDVLIQNIACMYNLTQEACAITYANFTDINK